MTDTITTTEKRESHQTVDTKTGEVTDHSTVETVTEMPAPEPVPEFIPDIGHHCTCEECQEFEEDLAHEIATLRLRVHELEQQPTPQMNPPPAAPSQPALPPSPAPVPVVPSADGGPAPPAVVQSPAEPPRAETIVKPPADKPEKRKRKHAGWFF